MIDLSLVVPAYNEAARLPGTLCALRTFFATRSWRSELIVVDDGSTDATADIARAESTPMFRLRVLSLGVNRGKHASINNIYIITLAGVG